MTPNLHPAAVRAAEAISRHFDWNPEECGHDEEIAKLALLIQNETRVAELTEALQRAHNRFDRLADRLRCKGGPSMVDYVSKPSAADNCEHAAKEIREALAQPGPDRQEEGHKPTIANLIQTVGQSTGSNAETVAKVADILERGQP